MQAAQFDHDGPAAAQALERGRAGVAGEGPGHVGVARGRRGLSIERRTWRAVEARRPRWRERWRCSRRRSPARAACRCRRPRRSGRSRRCRCTTSSPRRPCRRARAGTRWSRPARPRTSTGCCGRCPSRRLGQERRRRRGRGVELVGGRRRRAHVARRVARAHGERRWRRSGRSGRRCASRCTSPSRRSRSPRSRRHSKVAPGSAPNVQPGSGRCRRGRARVDVGRGRRAAVERRRR